MMRMPLASSTSWNRSRSPVTTSTGSAERAARVPITSSASNPGWPATASPAACSTSSITGTCTASAGGTSSDVPSAASRCALYDGSAATRKAGRQSASQHATSRAGCRARTSRVIMSSSPRTALTGVPSGARTVSGTPKNARKYSEAVSSSMSEPTLPSLHDGQAAQDNSTTLPPTILICFLGSGLGAGPATTAPSVILNRLPWQGQSIVPLLTWFTTQPTCVHTALNARYSPRAGWVTTTRAAVKTMPPPTGISPAVPSTTPRAAGFSLGAAPFGAAPLGMALLGMGLAEAGPDDGPTAMSGGAGPPGGTPASL